MILKYRIGRGESGLRRAAMLRIMLGATLAHDHATGEWWSNIPALDMASADAPIFKAREPSPLLGIVPKWPAKQRGGADAADVVAFDRYLVRVDRRGVNVRGDGARILTPRYYAPRASKVQVQP